MALSKKEILNLIYEYYGFARKREFSDFLGITAATLTNWYKRDTFDYDIIINKCSDIDLNKLFINNRVVAYEQKHSEEKSKTEMQNLGKFISLLKEKDQKIVEMSEKIGRLKEQIKQFEKSR